MSKPKPFTDYTTETLESEKTQREGKQEKGIWSGIYSKHITKDKTEDFYIKKSLKYPADNLSEVMTSDLLKNLIGFHAISYDFVSSDLPEDLKRDPAGLPREQGAEDYVVSQMRDGSKTLKALVYEKLPLGRAAMGANVFTEGNKRKIYNCLNAKQKAQLALILAGCALLLERDCQYGNIIFYRNPNDTNEYLNEEDAQDHKDVGKFDNGWGLAGICLPENARVDIFSSRQYMWSREGEGTGTGRGFPTNHFNDYPDVIHSQYFVNGLEIIVRESKKNLQLESVKKTILKIRNHFGKNQAVKEEVIKDKLWQLAEHMGLLTVLKNSVGSKEALEAFKNETSSVQMEAWIVKKLSDRLGVRTESLNALKVLLNMDLQYNPMEDIKNKHKKPDQKKGSAHVPYNPETDLRELKNHCLEILRKIQEERSVKGKTVAAKPIDFAEVIKRLPVFHKDIKSFIQKTIKKYSEDVSLGSQGPNHELIQFYDNLLKGNTQALSLSSGDLGTRQSNAIILSNMASRSPQPISRTYNVKRSPADHELLFLDPKESLSLETSYAASAHNKSLQSLENMAKSIINTMDTDEESKGKISYKTINIKKDEGFVVMQVEKKDSVVLKSNGNRIQLEAKPLEDRVDIQASINLQIKLFATALIEAGDLAPVITKGTPVQVIALLEEIKKQNKKIHPTIDSNIQFDDEQQKKVDKLLTISSSDLSSRAG